MKYTLIFFSLLNGIFLSAQCNYLAYDGFEYSADLPMEGMAGGTGWESPWHVQNNDQTVPGFNSIANSLTYSNLQVAGNAATGGISYLTLGRRLNTSENGPFSDYVTP